MDTEPNNLDDDFRENLFSRTKGLPLFTVEFLRVCKNTATLSGMLKENGLRVIL
jgi:hypothetical protein